VAWDRSVLLSATLLLVVVSDQVLKEAVFRAGRVLQVAPHLRIRPVRSTVAACSFGLGTSFLAFAWLAIALLALLVVSVSGPFSGLFHTPLSSAALGVALGGAASNLLDHFWRGAVLDYVDLPMWPVFNLADAGIVSGVLVVFIAR
jgi:signal peptidase II